MRSEIRSRSTSANSPDSVVMTLVWKSCLPSTRMFSLIAMKATPAFTKPSRTVTIWPSERPSLKSSLTTRQAVAAVENADQFTKPTALCRGLSPCCCLDEVVDLEAVYAGIFENGEALAACILLRHRDPEIGDGFHALL